MKVLGDRPWRTGSILVVALVVLIVILQNTQSVKTHVLWVTIDMPRILLLAICLAVGAVTGAIGSRYYWPFEQDSNK